MRLRQPVARPGSQHFNQGDIPMNQFRSLLGVSASLALVAVPMTAHAVAVTAVSSDAELISLLGGSGEPLLNWVAEGRIGVAGNGDFELDIGASTGGPFGPGQTAQLTWNDNIAGAFSLDYLAASGLATLSITQATGGSVNYTVAVEDRTPSTMYLRLRRPADNTSGIFFTNLTYNGTSGTVVLDNPIESPGNFSLPVVSNESLLIWQVSGLDFTNSFGLTGSLAFNFDPINPPTRSALAFQVKFGTPVPVPAAVWLLGSALAGLTAAARRRNG
jgi:hypothetical protein